QRTSKSVVQISLACGFASAAHFSNAYRERFAVTPREERRNWLDKQHGSVGVGAAAGEPRAAALFERPDGDDAQ
ncbi:MAG TPA: helix-turn-helix domain-containing protein, partial [Paraburkholderia sp.]